MPRRREGSRAGQGTKVDGADSPPPADVAPSPEERSGWKGGEHVSYSLEEVRRHETTIERALLEGHSERTLVAQAAKSLGVSKHRIGVLIKRVKRRWDEEDAEQRAHWKAQAMRRTLGYIRDARGRRDPADPNRWIERPNHTALVRYESFLADLQGTRAPLEVSVDVRYTEALSVHLASMSIEDLRALAAEAAEEKRLAEEYKLLLPSGSGEAAE